MLNPEDFSHQLDEALFGKQGGDREAAEAEKTGWQQKIKERNQKELSENSLVVWLEPRLPIKAALEVLRDKIAPGQEIKKWGPEKGNIAFSFIYSVATEKVLTGTYTQYIRSAMVEQPKNMPPLRFIKHLGLYFPTKEG